MGIIQHNSIIVSGNTAFEEDFQKVYDFANNLFGSLVTPIITTDLNRYTFFFVAPDGSKEGWAESDSGDENRKQLCDYIDSLVFEDGSNGINYVDVSHGEYGAMIKRTNEIDYYGESEGEQ